MPEHLQASQCMLCGSMIVWQDGVWWLMSSNDDFDPWWKDHCTGHDLGGLRGKPNPDLVHVPRPDVTDVDALEEWLDA